MGEWFPVGLVGPMALTLLFFNQQEVFMHNPVVDPDDTVMARVMTRLEALEKENKELKATRASGFSLGGEVFITYSEFKGKTTIVVNGAGKPLSFGKTKAKAIVKLFDEIKAFAESPE